MIKKRKEPKNKRNSWQQYVGLAFMILIGAVSGFIMVSYLGGVDENLPLYQELLALVGLFICMYVAFFFHMIVHEAGHLVFGLMTGYKFSSFRIASLMWQMENGRLKLKRISISGTGGQCLMTPPDIKDGEIPFVLYNLGGSIINTVAGALFLTGHLLCSDVRFLSSALLIFAAVGFMTAMMNGIPMRMGTVDNDRYNALAVSRSKEAAMAFWVQLKVAEQSSKGVRLKDMPSDWFEVPTDEDMKNSMVAAQCVFACNRLMDAEKYEEADSLMAHLLQIESGIVGLHRNLLICDRMYLELIGENRVEVIRNMMTKEQKKFMRAMRRFPSVLRTEYALALLLEKDAARAETVELEFEKAAKSYPYPHEIDSERELMNIVKIKNDQKRSNTYAT